MLNMLFANPYLSTNLALLLSFAFSGLGAFLLAKRYLKSILLAFLVGFIFAYCPYKTSHLLEHYHLLLTGFVPFFILAMLQIWPATAIKLDKESIKWWALAIICFVFTLLSDYYTSFFLLFFSLFYAAYKLFVKYNTFSSRQILIVVLTVFVLSHLLIEPYSLAEHDDRGAFYNTADLLSWFTPPENSMVYGKFFENIRAQAQFKGPNEQVMFLGFSLILLILFLRPKTWDNEMKLISFMAVMFMLLCIPKWKFMGQGISFSPTAWFHYIPFFNNIRNPSRFVAMVYLFLPILLFYGLEYRLARIGLGRRFIYLILIITVAMDYLPKPYPSISTSDLEPFASEIAQDESIKVLCYIPTGIADGFKQEGLFNVKRLQDQLVHEKALVGGYISRVPESQFSKFANNKILSVLNSSSIQNTIDTASVNSFKNQDVLDFLQEYDVDLFVLDVDDLSAINTIKLLFADQITKQLVIGEKQLIYLDSAS